LSSIAIANANLYGQGVYTSPPIKKMLGLAICGQQANPVSHADMDGSVNVLESGRVCR